MNYDATRIFHPIKFYEHEHNDVPHPFISSVNIYTVDGWTVIYKLLTIIGLDNDMQKSGFLKK